MSIVHLEGNQKQQKFVSFDSRILLLEILYKAKRKRIMCIFKRVHSSSFFHLEIPLIFNHETHTNCGKKNNKDSSLSINRKKKKTEQKFES